jgi:uncharacterized membrane protein
MRSAGPLEVLVVSFPGEGLPEGVDAALERIQENDAVRVVEAFLVLKTGTGAVRIEEVTDVVGLAEVATDVRLALPDASLWLDQANAQEIADALDNGSTALALVLEHHSARDVVTAFRSLGGLVLASTRLPTAAGPTPPRPPARNG